MGPVAWYGAYRQFAPLAPGTRRDVFRAKSNGGVDLLTHQAIRCRNHGVKRSRRPPAGEGGLASSDLYSGL